MQVLLQHKKWQLFLMFWIVNVLLSVAYKFYYYHTGDHLPYTWIPDMLFLSLVIIATLSKRNILAFLGVLFLFLFKAIGSWSIASFYPTQMDLAKDVVKTSMGYVCLFPLFLFVSKNNPIERPRSVKHTFVIVAGVFALSLFVGLVLPFHVFDPYSNPSRLGVSGLLYPSSYVSY